ncbi:hypothetical protein FF38_07853 [Lucilia cuprina]|uniref:LysM domain-containing protein n=1 Tax=Lucilia cuprina TaxID=7375 RepID=A0A0L0BXW9_LUCCU|nr:hypothetical protein CVS40_0784 [Lucilia cuprina]KNC24868.1 hypothetical protein FF38_07853 [Lucilia cuprina]
MYGYSLLSVKYFIIILMSSSFCWSQLSQDVNFNSNLLQVRSGRTYMDIARVINPNQYAHVGMQPYPGQPFWPQGG